MFQSHGGMEMFPINGTGNCRNIAQNSSDLYLWLHSSRSDIIVRWLHYIILYRELHLQEVLDHLIAAPCLSNKLIHWVCLNPALNTKKLLIFPMRNLHLSHLYHNHLFLGHSMTRTSSVHLLHHIMLLLHLRLIVILNGNNYCWIHLLM